MKYYVISLALCICFHANAQKWSTIEKYRIVACLVKGRLGNFVNPVGNELQFDFRDRNIDKDEMCQKTLASMQVFLSYYLDKEERKQYKIVFLTLDENKHLRKRYPLVIPEYQFNTDTIQATDQYLNVLPYYTFYSHDKEGDQILLKRIMGYSPIDPDPDFISLIAWVYKKQFATRVRDGIFVTTEYGSDRKIKKNTYCYERGYHYGYIESVIRKKINEVGVN